MALPGVSSGFWHSFWGQRHKTLHREVITVPASWNCWEGFVGALVFFFYWDGPELAISVIHLSTRSDRLRNIGKLLRTLDTSGGLAHIGGSLLYHS